MSHEQHQQMLQMASSMNPQRDATRSDALRVQDPNYNVPDGDPFASLDELEIDPRLRSVKDV